MATSIRYDKKCGSSHIPDNYTCRKGGGGLRSPASQIARTVQAKRKTQPKKKPSMKNTAVLIGGGLMVSGVAAAVGLAASKRRKGKDIGRKLAAIEKATGENLVVKIQKKPPGDRGSAKLTGREPVVLADEKDWQTLDVKGIAVVDLSEIAGEAEKSSPALPPASPATKAKRSRKKKKKRERRNWRSVLGVGPNASARQVGEAYSKGMRRAKGRKDSDLEGWRGDSTATPDDLRFAYGMAKAYFPEVSPQEWWAVENLI